MIHVITILLAFIVVATVFYWYGYKTGYSHAMDRAYMFDRAAEEFAREYVNTLYESEDE